MSFAPSIAENIRTEVETLIELVSGPASQQQTAYEIEGQLWWRMLALGRLFLDLFFASRSTEEDRQTAYVSDGVSYPYEGERSRRYVSLFGEVTIRRAYYRLKGQGGYFPLDEKLSLPKRCYSDWVQERVAALSVTRPYDEALALLSGWLALDLSKRSAEAIDADHAEYMRAYDEQREAPPLGDEDSIMVVSADGKGIPMIRSDSPAPESRQGDKSRKTAKKEATLTTIYTIQPYERTVEHIIQVLLGPDKPEWVPRPQPTGKQVFGTLSNQQAAFEHLVEQVNKRDTAQISHRVALTDGDRGLKKKVQVYLPNFTLIIDIMHVMGYLYQAAEALFTSTSAQRETWLEDALRCLLQDDLDTLLTHLHQQMQSLSTPRRKTLSTVRSYLINNRPHLYYQSYLAQGFPIGTGVIEGACRHLVKDRFELTGMRWSKAGAQVMLDLRAIYLNGDWDAFQQFRRQEAHQQHYRSPHPHLISQETLLTVAA